jgi:hypothetical protein
MMEDRRPRSSSLLLLFLLGAILPFVALADEENHEYKDGDVIPFLVNTIGPYANPSEVYSYYSLPVCAPPKEQRSPDRDFNLGESLEGDEFKKSLYVLKFKVDEKDKELCSPKFNVDEISRLKKAIEEYYYFELLCDDLPVHGFLGTVDEDKRYLFTHVQFNVLYNNNQVIAVNVTSDLRKVVELGELKPNEQSVRFTYAVKWHPTDTPFEERVYLPSLFFNSEMEIHWLSIMNSFVLVILLTGFLSIIIMRVLKSDYSRYNEEEADEEDYGWKLVHGDVFRFPAAKNLFCAMVGTGAQFLCVAGGLLLLALVGMFYPGSHGSLYTATIVLYALTSAVAGGISARLFRQMHGQWACL